MKRLFLPMGIFKTYPKHNNRKQMPLVLAMISQKRLFFVPAFLHRTIAAYQLK